MKEFSKIGDYYVKDAQARESIKALEERLDAGGDNALTDEQKNEIFAYVKSKLQTKAFVFTLDDDSTVTVNVVVKE